MFLLLNIIVISRMILKSNFNIKKNTHENLDFPVYHPNNVGFWVEDNQYLGRELVFRNSIENKGGLLCTKGWISHFE